MRYDTDSSHNKNPPAAAKAKPPHDAPMLKVFLIEDSALLQELLSGMVSELDGVEFCGCADGETEALHRLAETPVDLVIIDIELKQGSGIGVLDALQSDLGLYGNPRKAVLTNYAQATMRQRCERFGMDAFFDKSMDINQLMDYVAELSLKKSLS
jgi:CheY-like chemotaxis protein